MQHLCIVTTGGTIDKIYFDDKSAYEIGEPQIGKILDALGVAFSFDVLPAMRKDSLHLDDADRDDEMDDVATRNRRMTGLMQGVARQVSLNPNDGMEL